MSATYEQWARPAARTIDPILPPDPAPAVAPPAEPMAGFHATDLTGAPVTEAGAEPGAVPQPWWRNRLYQGIAAAGAAVVAVAAIITAILLATTTTTLDSAAAEDGIVQILTHDYAISRNAMGPVSCPSGQEVHVGSTFNCSLTINGLNSVVTVKFLDGNGKYEVSWPRVAQGE